MDKKFLIIRFSSIGDIVLTTPVVRCLRKKYPNAAIHYLTKKQFAGIIDSNPYVDKVILLKEDINETIAEVREENYDCIIDLHHNLRTLRIKQALKKVPFHSFNKLNVEKWIFTNFKIKLMPHKHIVDRYMETVERLGVVNDGAGLDYFVPEKDQVKESDIPFSHLHGEIIAESDPVKIYNACGKFSLNESADLVRRAKLVISHDTGLMHIAAAFKKNILSVWGNTMPSFGMTPYQTKYEVFQVNKLWCRPCSKTGYDKCPLGHFKCMNNQSIDAIADNAHAAMGIEAND